VRTLCRPRVTRELIALPEAKNGAALPDHIYMDACNVEEARRVYDALLPVSPIMVGHAATLSG